VNKHGHIITKDGAIYARVRYVDFNGRKREVVRKAQSRNNAKRLINDLLVQVKTLEFQLNRITAEMTFDEVADRYAEVRHQEAVYRDERKIAGLRSLKSAQAHLLALRSIFGSRKVREITVGQIESYKSHRLIEKTNRGNGDRKIASVNRELEVLRAIFNYAVGENIISVSPFDKATTTLISKADEVRRVRVMTKDEESRLLENCPKLRSDSAPLDELIVCAVDTGMRKGEMLALRWADVDFEARTIIIRALTTKTLTTRTVPMSSRLANVLRMRERENGVVWKGVGDFKKSWKTLCKLAGVDDLRWHDLRATFITRLIEAGMSVELVAKLSGHTQIATLYRTYLRITEDAVSKARELLDKQ